MRIREKSSLHKLNLLVWLPHILVVFWLIYLGITIWQHAVHSVQPPIGDSLQYMMKAMNFWQAVEHGKFINPLNLGPAFRPPGTILMSYPFGFSPDFHGFYFRSVFLPILCIVAAVYVVAGTARAKASGWCVSAMAFLFSSLPMLYQFDWVEGINGPVRWGLVDNFQAGIAAMAAAALVRSVMARSQPWLLFCASLAALTLLIKPSGLMVMALVTLIWLIVNAMEWRWSLGLQSSLSTLRVYAVKGISGILIIYSSVIALCVFSGYLSRDNFAYAKQALAVLRKQSQISLQDSLLLFHQSSGETLLLWVIGVAVVFIFSFKVARKSNELLPVRVLGILVGSLVIWSLGAWYWLVVQAGITQIRYFYPFMLMGAVCMIPASLYMWSYANRLIRIILMTICFLPAINIAGVLAAGDDPSLYWQKISGVSVSVGGGREEVRQAYTFLAELRKAKNNVQIYSFSNGVLPAIFENVGAYEKTVRPVQPSFHAAIPLDYIRGFAVRVNELLDCDYILIRKYGNQDTRGFWAAKKFDSFDSETKGFEVWLSTLNEQSGVEAVSDGRILRLLRIVDRVALSRAIDLFVAAHAWRPEFTEAAQPIWWSANTVSAYVRNLAAKEIGFDGIYKLHALAINRIDSGVKIDIWWEELRHEEANNQRYLFLHLVDSYGRILYIKGIALYPYNPLFENRRWRYSKATFNLQLPNKDVASLALGIYQPPGSFLLANNKEMQTDWEGRRILIPITSLSLNQHGTTASVQR